FTKTQIKVVVHDGGGSGRTVRFACQDGGKGKGVWRSGYRRLTGGAEARTVAPAVTMRERERSSGGG
ncbi:hypothetical protein A2U01_0010596, partial [Trifolium medium]|nr:hypothetical protein [Trifolium medium]